MIKKLAALFMALFLMMTGAVACGGNGDEDPDASGNGQTHTQEYTDEEMRREIQKMKDEGILDENGQPMPGVDLRDYPGLG